MMNKELDALWRMLLPATTPANPPSTPNPLALYETTAPFLTYRHSFTQISSQDGNVHVQKKETVFENGRMTSEQMEGTLDPAVYDDMMRQAQTRFFSQMADVMNLFYLPFGGMKPPR